MIPHRLLALGLCAAMAAPAFAEAPARTDLLGDPLPEGAISRMGSGRLRSARNITCLSFTPDGKSLVSGGTPHKLTFWSVATGRIEKEWTLSVPRATGIHFDRAGKTMALSAGDGTVRILDGANGAERRRMLDSDRRSGTVYGNLSPDGKWLVVHNHSYRRVNIFSVDSGVLRHSFPNIMAPDRPTGILTPDSKHFVSLWTDNKIHLVDLATGTSVRRLETSSVPSNSSYSRMTLSADGKRLVYQNSSDRHFYVVDVTDCKEIKKIDRGAASSYSSAGSDALTPNGRFIIEGRGDAICVWGVASGKMLREFSAPNTVFTSAIVSPDGKLVAASFDSSIYLWDLASGKQLHGGTGHANAITHLAFSPDGRSLVSTGRYSMRVWESATGKELAATRPPPHVAGYNTSYLEVAPDNQSIRWIGYDRAVYRWRFAAESEPVKRTTPKGPLVNGPSGIWVTSPDGKRFAAFSAIDGRVRLLDNVGNAPDRELAKLPPNHSVNFRFSPDGRTLAAVSSDRSVTLYDVATGDETRKLVATRSENPYMPLVEFSPDGRTLFHDDGEARVAETTTGGDRTSLSREPGRRPDCVAWSADGRLVARGFADGTAVVTDLWTGRDIFRRRTGQGEVNALCLSRDGKRFATGGSDTTAVVWELAPLGKIASVASMTDDAAWDDLRDQDAARAHRAMLHLIAGPDATVRLFADRLKPRPAVDAKHIDRLVSNLDDDDSKVRERASAELLEVGRPALGALKKAARSPSLEVKRRARDLLRRLEPGTGIAPGRLRAERAVEILERIGTPAARAALEAMLKSKSDTTR